MDLAIKKGKRELEESARKQGEEHTQKLKTAEERWHNMLEVTEKEGGERERERERDFHGDIV